jgi:hypothetical protein
MDLYSSARDRKEHGTREEYMADTHSTPIRVLFLGTHNSARSRVAEVLLRHDSGGRSDIDSTGAHPDDRWQRCNA